jgi:hypothetical protein
VINVTVNGGLRNGLRGVTVNRRWRENIGSWREWGFLEKTLGF